MANPWDSDPVVGGNPWDNDPIDVGSSRKIGPPGRQVKDNRPNFNNVRSEVRSRSSRRAPKETIPYAGSAYEGQRQALNAGVHHGLKFLHGTADLAQTGMTNAAEILGLPFATKMRRTLEDDRRATADWEADYQASQPDGVSTAVGAAVGSIAPWTIGLPARAMTFTGGILSKLLPGISGRVLGGAAQGGLIGSTVPVQNTDDYAAEKARGMATAAAVGGVLPPLAGAFRGSRSALQYIFDPQSVAARNLARNLQADQSTVQALRGAREYIPGERPTTAQVLATPEAVATEKALLNNPDYKVQATARANDNNALRMSVLRRLAGTDDEIAAAYQKRRDNAGPFRADQLPEQGSKMVDAAQIFETLGRLSKSANPAVRGAAREHLSLLRSQADKSGRVPAYALDDVRQNAGAVIAKHTPQGMQASQEATKYNAVSSQILRTLDRAIPGYRDYLATYRADSAPIGTMEGVRRVLGPVDQRGLNSAGDTSITLSQLNAGLGRIDKSRYGVTPEARAELDGLRRSLQRESISNSVRSPGSDTAYNLQADNWLARQVLGRDLSGPGPAVRAATPFLGGVIGANFGGPVGAGAGMALGSGVKKGAEFVNKRILDAYAKGMLNPREAALMIESFLQKNANTSAARQQLLEAYPQWGAILESTRNSQESKE